VRYCKKEHLYFVVGCDSNVHHSKRGSTNCNSRGEALVEILNTTTLEILNRGNEPTFCSGDRPEVIDITLGSLRLLESIKAGRSHLSLPCQITDIFFSSFRAPYQCA
jgi:hypothetical protein